MNIERDFELNLRWSFYETRNYTVAFGLLFIILILIYSNSFHCSWHYDDLANIVDNTSIRIKDFSWPEIEKSFDSLSGIEKSLYGTANSQTTWSRPLAYFSFAVNYYFDGTDVFGSHLVNFAIHYLSAVFLFLFIYNMLKLPLLNDRYGSYAYSAALLSAVLWAIQPIQVTAVTYIVQRMASMVALFYIMAMYLYLKGRTAHTIAQTITFYSLCFISFILALGSKQNAAMLPASILLFDLYFIQGINKRNVVKVAKILLVMIICALIILFFYINHDRSAIDYGSRMYGMMERLLSQPRIFFSYVSLLLYPLNSRLMLVHDVDISTSLFIPWTTPLAIAALLGILGFVLWKSRRMPILAYCILFFFMNHLIEGSFFALELFYEHRNYLPSMLFFLPVTIGLLNMLDFFAEKKVVFFTMVSAISIMMIIWGVTTFMYNDIFKDELTLWLDNTKKAPALHIPHNNLARAYLREGRLIEAYDECQKASQSVRMANLSNKHRTDIILAQYYNMVKDTNKALYYTDKALKHFPAIADFYYLKGLILMEKKEWSSAEKEIRKAISLNPDNAVFRFNLGLIYLHQRHFDRTVGEAKNALRINPDSWQAYLLIADAFKAQGNQKMADHFLQVSRRGQLEQQVVTGNAHFN